MLEVVIYGSQWHIIKIQKSLMRKNTKNQIGIQVQDWKVVPGNASGITQNSSKEERKRNLRQRLTRHHHRHNYSHSEVLGLRSPLFGRDEGLFSKYHCWATKPINRQPLAFYLEDSTVLPPLFLYVSAIKRRFLRVLGIWLNQIYRLVSRPNSQVRCNRKRQSSFRSPRTSVAGWWKFCFLYYFPFHKRNRLQERISNAMLLGTDH